jgi:hypothetical protein
MFRRPVLPALIDSVAHSNYPDHVLDLFQSAVLTYYRIPFSMGKDIEDWLDECGHLHFAPGEMHLGYTLVIPLRTRYSDETETGNVHIPVNNVKAAYDELLQSTGASSITDSKGVDMSTMNRRQIAASHSFFANYADKAKGNEEKKVKVPAKNREKASRIVSKWVSHIVDLAVRSISSQLSAAKKSGDIKTLFAAVANGPAAVLEDAIAAAIRNADEVVTNYVGSGKAIVFMKRQAHKHMLKLMRESGASIQEKAGSEEMDRVLARAVMEILEGPVKSWALTQADNYIKFIKDTQKTKIETEGTKKVDRAIRARYLEQELGNSIQTHDIRTRVAGDLFIESAVRRHRLETGRTYSEALKRKGVAGRVQSLAHLVDSGDRDYIMLIPRHGITNNDTVLYDLNPTKPVRFKNKIRFIKAVGKTPPSTRYAVSKDGRLVSKTGDEKARIGGKLVEHRPSLVQKMRCLIEMPTEEDTTKQDTEE